MAPVVTFGSADIRYKEVPQVDKEVPQVEDVEMEQVPEKEKEEDAVQAALAPRFECASL